MTVALLGTLVVLALVDSTSFGTLLIPIWLMLAPGRLRPGRIVVFLATVAGFYLVLGLLLVAGVARFSDQIADALDTRPVQAPSSSPVSRCWPPACGRGSAGSASRRDAWRSGASARSATRARPAAWWRSP
nr:hypothetical protein [Aeromicrobium sp. CFBP 8757]